MGLNANDCIEIRCELLQNTLWNFILVSKFVRQNNYQLYYYT